MRTPRFTRTAALALGIALAISAAGCGGDSGGPATTGPPPPTKELNSSTLNQNQTYPHTFSVADTFAYKCTIHPAMTGTVQVNTTTAAGDQTVDISGFAFSPQVVSVHPGNKVTWTNKDSAPHTVTSP